MLNQNEELTSQCELNFANAIFLRRTVLPVAYITGHKEFFGYDFIVSPDVLIPKPDTEILVEKAIDYIKEKVFANPNKILTICDMCTGSGAIAISLSKLIENASVSASDISDGALNVAKENAILNKVDIDFINTNIYENIDNKFDVVISNPPYIAYDEEIMDIVKNNEPHLALYAEDEGLYFYKKITII